MDLPSGPTIERREYNYTQRVLENPERPHLCQIEDISADLQRKTDVVPFKDRDEEIFQSNMELLKQNNFPERVRQKPGMLYPYKAVPHSFREAIEVIGRRKPEIFEQEKILYNLDFDKMRSDLLSARREEFTRKPWSQVYDLKQIKADDKAAHVDGATLIAVFQHKQAEKAAAKGKAAKEAAGGNSTVLGAGPGGASTGGASSKRAASGGGGGGKKRGREEMLGDGGNNPAESSGTNAAGAVPRPKAGASGKAAKAKAGASTSAAESAKGTNKPAMKRASQEQDGAEAGVEGDNAAGVGGGKKAGKPPKKQKTDAGEGAVGKK